MKTEIEAKFLDINFGEIRKRLNSVGAHCMQPMRLMRRVIMDTEDSTLQQNNGYVRVRDEGHRVSLTYKSFDETQELHIASAKEIEIKVSSFEDTIALLRATGLAVKSFQESRRETWKLGKVEIVLDEWPWLKPYIEVEAATEKLVKSAANKLELEWSKAVFGDVMAAYRAQYPHLHQDQTVASLDEVKFGDTMPSMLKQPGVS